MTMKSPSASGSREVTPLHRSASTRLRLSSPHRTTTHAAAARQARVKQGAVERDGRTQTYPLVLGASTGGFHTATGVCLPIRHVRRGAGSVNTSEGDEEGDSTSNNKALAIDAEERAAEAVRADPAVAEDAEVEPLSDTLNSSHGTLGTSEASIFSRSRCVAAGVEDTHEHAWLARIGKAGGGGTQKGDAAQVSCDTHSLGDGARSASLTPTLFYRASTPAGAGAHPTVADIVMRTTRQDRAANQHLRRDPHHDNESACGGRGCAKGRVPMDEPCLTLLPRRHGVNEALLLDPEIPLPTAADEVSDSTTLSATAAPSTSQPLLLETACQAFREIILQPVTITLHDTSAGGTYMVSSHLGNADEGAAKKGPTRPPRIVGVFKPRDEEIGQDCNPHGNIGSDRADVFTPGTGSRREVLAYRLDHGGLAGVPPTMEVATHLHCPRSSTNRPQHDHAKDETRANPFLQPRRGVKRPPEMSTASRIGSLQYFVPGCVEASDVLPGKFAVDDVHALAIFDIRTLNGDRHGGNILVHYERPTATSASSTDASRGAVGEESEGSEEGDDEASPAAELVPRLVPIDHSYICPSGYSEPEYEWLFWPQSKQPFTARSLAYIQALDAAADAELVRTALLARSVGAIAPASFLPSSATPSTGTRAAACRELSLSGVLPSTNEKEEQQRTRVKPNAIVCSEEDVNSAGSNRESNTSERQTINSAVLSTEHGDAAADATLGRRPAVSPSALDLRLPVSEDEACAALEDVYVVTSPLIPAPMKKTRNLAEEAEEETASDLSSDGDREDADVCGTTPSRAAAANAKTSRSASLSSVSDNDREGHLAPRPPSIPTMATHNRSAPSHSVSDDVESANAAADVIFCTTRLLQIAALEFGLTAKDVGELLRRPTLTCPSFFEEVLEEQRDMVTWRVDRPAFEAEVRRRMREKDLTSAAAKAADTSRFMRW